MICPRCGEKNNENNNNCSNCNLKLKIVCPKCKNLCAIKQEKCDKCGFRLVVFCPKCKSANHPQNNKCKKCDLQLLKPCAKCKTLNYRDDLKCIKCSESFGKSASTVLSQNNNMQNLQKDNAQVLQKSHAQTPPAQKPPEKFRKLPGCAVLAVELINLVTIKTKLEPDVLKELIKEYYYIVITEAKRKQEMAKKASAQLANIEFKKSPSPKISAASAIVTAQRIMAEVDELNSQLIEEFDVELKVKIGISIPDGKDNNKLSEVERLVASAGDIIVNTAVFNLVQDMFDFEQASSLPGQGVGVFYKLLTSSEETSGDIQVIEYEKEPEEEESEDASEYNRKRIEAYQLKDKKAGLNESVIKISQEETFNRVTETINRERKGYIFGISGLEGAGRSTIISSIKQSVANEKVIALIVQCNPVNKVIPYAFFQDLLKTMFNLPPIIFNVPESKKIISAVLENNEIKSKEIEKIIYKLLFQEFLSVGELEIFENKKETFEEVKNLFTALANKFRIVLIIDDIEFIDPLSLELIKYLLDNIYLDSGNNIIATHSLETNLNDYLYHREYADRMVKIELNPMMPREMDMAILSMLNNQDILPNRVKSEIFYKSKGLPLYIEHALWLLFQTGSIYPEGNMLRFNANILSIEFPDTVEEIIRERLTRIKNLKFDFSNIMLSASIFGQRFMPAIVQLMLGMKDQQFNELIQMLFANGIFVNLDNNSFLIKHKMVWDQIYKSCLTPEEKRNCHSKAFDVLKKYTKVCSAQIALHAESAGQLEEAVEHWNKASQEAASVGDFHAYTMAQKQILGLIDSINLADGSDRDRIKHHIFECLGIVNHEINPEESIYYLSNAILKSESLEETAKVIELTGYLSKSCDLLGNYAGIIESVDRALAGLNKIQYPIEYALLCYSKLNTLFNMGRLEETVFIAKSVVIPVLRDCINAGISVTGLSNEDLLYIQSDTDLTFIKTLAVQGNKEAADKANHLAIKAKDQGFIDIETQAKLVDALYKSLQGRTKPANAIWSNVRDLIPLLKDNKLIKLYWNFINVLGEVFHGNYGQAGQLCYSLLDLAEECREYNLYLVIKLILAKALKEAGNIEKAKNMYNEIILESSNHKMATGALLGWYFIAEAEMEFGSINSAYEIAHRALEISQKTDIDNYYFTVLLQGLLAEIQVIRKDFLAANMFLDKALTTAKEMELYYPQIKLYLTWGKIYWGMAAVEENNKRDNVLKASNAYSTALQLAQMIENEFLLEEVNKQFSELAEFCYHEDIQI